MKTALVTGTAGFIGFHLATRLLSEGWKVVGLDALTERYDVSLKTARLDQLRPHANLTHVEARLETPGAVTAVVDTHKPDIIVHLAAEAGVRQSIEDPRAYLEANVIGTFELLEAARANPPRHMLMASTSSAYGANKERPYAETMRADWPVSFYAATKKSTEILAHSHAHLYDVPITMLRFFTVYGPWGRPDMAYSLFADAILNDRPIRVFNHGKMERDFLFVDDLVEAILRLFDAAPQRPADPDDIPDGDSLSPVAPFRVVNIGKSDPDTLMEFIEAIEAALGKTAVKQMEDMQQGDVPATWADARLLKQLTGYLPSTPLSEGIPKFVDWYVSHSG